MLYNSPQKSTYLRSFTVQIQLLYRKTLFNSVILASLLIKYTFHEFLCVKFVDQELSIKLFIIQGDFTKFMEKFVDDEAKRQKNKIFISQHKPQKIL